MILAVESNPERLVRSLGIGGRYQGLRYMVVSVELYRHAPYGVSLTKEIYPTVAKQFQVSQFSVERNLRTFCKAVWEHGDRARLNEVAGYRVIQKPTPGELIDILSAYLNAQPAQ